jgi:pimeloyl-ACP methyl ester carboxylesterase
VSPAVWRAARAAGVLVALLALWPVVNAAGASDPLEGLTISTTCREFMQKNMLGQAGAELVLGYLYYTQDAAGSACGWSTSSPYLAFAHCVQSAKKRGIAAPCLAIVSSGVIVGRSYAEARRLTLDDAWELTMANDEMRCGQEPGDRFYWLEHGFCDMPRHGPERARGLVLWNHGIAGTMVQHQAPPALAIRLLQARGWDVIKLNRHNLGEDAGSYRRAEERVLEEIRAPRAKGYRKIVLAGQSFGGRVALELGTQTADVFATITMAPGMETTVGNSRSQAPTDHRLRLAKTERVAVVFPGQDDLFGHPERGKTAGPILAQRGRPYLMLDETAGLRGHGGGTGGNFAFRYGLCLEEFVSAESVPAGRFPCRPSDGRDVARELLPPVPRYLKVSTQWYGLLGETIVSWALVQTERPTPSILYTWATSSSRGGGVYPATANGAEITAVLPNQSVLTVKPIDDRRLDATWTPRAGTTSNFSMHSRAAETLRGELLRLDAEP